MLHEDLKDTYAEKIRLAVTAVSIVIPYVTLRAHGRHKKAAGAEFGNQWDPESYGPAGKIETTAGQA